ncbi:MAG: C69 family dipeptidase [Burkholderiaceae bacterium]
MSYALYIGKNNTADGVSYLAGYGDEPSSHWLEVVARTSHASGDRITVGVTPQADLPGRLSTIAQVEQTARHIRVSYSHYKGVPAPLTNGGLNEYGVAVRDVWSSSRADLVAMTPADQSGPNYSDLARLVLERAHTAREGVALIGELIARHGYADYGGNSHLIADPHEAWVVIEFSGGQRLWAAERLGVDSIRASRPGYIGDIPVHQPDHPDYLYSPNLVSFAVEQGWFKPGSQAVFNVNAIYGDGKGRWAGVQWIEAEMTRRARTPQKISIADIMWAVRTEKLTGDTAGYGQVVPLQHPAHDALRTLWHTQVGAIAAPFVPVFMGMREVPEEFRQHRHLSEGESARFLDLRHARKGKSGTVSHIPQGVESTRSASEIFKRLLNLLAQRSGDFLPEITALWEAVERRLLAAHPGVLETAQTLFAADKSELAEVYLSYYARTELLGALDLAETMASSLEARTRVHHGFRTDPQPLSAEQIW